MPTRTSLIRFGLAAGIVAFAAAAVLVIADRHKAFHWILLGGTVANMVILRASQKPQTRAS